MTKDFTEHWETIYKTKQASEVSWSQEIPQTSLDFIHLLNLPKTAKIIDIGGGDSKLVDYLLDEGYQHITVLDISATAIEKAKKRLGEKAANVNWIVSDICSFIPETTYDIWHDRAAFHFLTSAEQIDTYKKLVQQAAAGFMIIATFSKDGPKKCSGLDIRQYTAEALQAVFNEHFLPLQSLYTNHITPFNTAQNFVFCSFKSI